MHPAGRLLLAFAVSALLALPAASARPAPVLYFLKDGADGPVGDGLLDAYDPEKGNVPNSTSPHSRFIFPGQDQVVPVRFVAAEADHPVRVFGPLWVGLWLGESATLNGNLTATLFEYQDAGTPGLPAQPKVLASATVALDADPEALPNATTLVPPTPDPVPPDPDPNDPQGSVNRTVAHEQAQAMMLAFYEAAQLAPMILQPPAVLNMGTVDFTVNATSRMALGFRLDAGSSPGPVPVAAFGQIIYDSMPNTACLVCGPSYLYMPWYAPDPVVVPQPPASPTTSSSPTGDGTSHDDGATSSGPTKKKGIPGLEPVLLAACALAAAMLARRRLP